MRDAAYQEMAIAEAAVSAKMEEARYGMACILDRELAAWRVESKGAIADDVGYPDIIRLSMPGAWSFQGERILLFLAPPWTCVDDCWFEVLCAESEAEPDDSFGGSTDQRSTLGINLLSIWAQ